MKSTTFTVCASIVGLSAFAYACGFSATSSDFSAPAGEGARGDASAAAPSGGSANENDLRPVDNAVILVHAAKALPFRLCFENELDRRPAPDAEVMPESSLVGVDVGTAVRLGPLKGPPGAIFVFDEPLIRDLYGAFGSSATQPSCRSLLTSDATKNLGKRLDLGPRNTAADKDLSHDVHLLVLTGCTGNNVENTYSQEECGSDWSPIDGNISIKEIPILGAHRPSTTTLPAQIVNLAQPLESARAGRTLTITFGDLTPPDAGTAEHATVSQNPQLFGAPSPSKPASLPYDPGDVPSYDKIGFRIQLDDPTKATPPKIVLDQTLARVQKLSSPRDVPTTYFAAASNYALLLLGDPAPTFIDGGPDDTERRKLHLLAVPVINPKGDGGADPP